MFVLHGFGIYKSICDMNISDFMRDFPQAQLVVTVADLREFAMELIESAKREEAAKDKEDKLFVTEDVRAKLGVSTTTLCIWKKRGLLVPVKVGKRNLYRQSDIERMLSRE